jgi:Sulfotransferase domain
MNATTIAMWSGPRNISTAMMYAFGNRPDCQAWDEPFYAFSLKTLGNDHPMRAEIIAENDSDWDRLVARCVGGPAPPKTVFYQKHMTHHMLPGYDRRWILQVANAFLIREPERVLASYAQKWSEVSLRAIGFIEQGEIFDMVAQKLGRAPPVVDADDILGNPRDMLNTLCETCGIPFLEEMLHWPKGPKPFDGNWAKHWYNAAWQSTGFAKPPNTAPELPDELKRIADEARPIYERLKRFSIAPSHADKI